MKTFSSLLLLLLPGFVLAQDPIFSQFYANKPLLNPALTALDEGTTVTLNHRNQWYRIPGGFRTYVAAAEMQRVLCAKKGKLHPPFFNFGFGVVALHDEEGEGLLQTNELHVSASAYHLIRQNAAWHIGASLGGGQKSLDLDRLTFADQLHAIEGKILAHTGAPIDYHARSFADLGAGAALRFGHRFGDAEGFQSIGASYRHALNPLESLIEDRGARLPGLFAFHYGGVLPVWRDHQGHEKYYIYWSPQLQVLWQGRFRVIGYGLYGLYRSAMVGCFLRHPFGARSPEQGANTHTLMFTAGYEHALWGGDNLFRLDYSYDLNVGGLGLYGGGAHELSLKVNMFGLLRGGCKPSVNDGKKRNVGGCPAWPGSQSRRF
ncbi:MAG: PorP/SprF family type IX secretion system membrane protein [Saprospiraceae bacterium]